MSLKIKVAEDYDQMSIFIADLISACIALNSRSNLGLATGSTPLGAYKDLVRRFKLGRLSFAKVQTCNLDEYIGLAPDDPNSYRYFMNENLFDKVDIKPENTHIPNGHATDLESYCQYYDKLVLRLSPDIQLLGLGPNGHIGFNEPGSFIAETHVTNLSEATLEANKKYFKNAFNMPKQAITLGLAGIMIAKTVILAVSGEAKAQALKAMIEGEISDKLPASILKLHPDVRIIADSKALSLLDDVTLSNLKK